MEGLIGIYVLIAISRPDLIDPILLRLDYLDKFISSSAWLSDRTGPPRMYFETMDAGLPVPVDDMVDQSNLKQCIIELPTNIFDNLRDRAEGQGVEIVQGRAANDVRL